MFYIKINKLLSNSHQIALHRIFTRLNHQTKLDGLRQYFDKEINKYKETGRLPSTFHLDDAKYYETLSHIRSKSDRLSYLRSLISVLKTPPSFAIPIDSGGIHTGFVTPYRVLRQSDLVDISSWNYLKAQRLNDNLFLDCSNISSQPLAQLIIDMRAKLNLLNEPWWPILIGISDDHHQEIIEILKTKYQLQDFTLICANRGETIYELDSNKNYIVQIDGDERQCCLGNAKPNSENLYENIVKVESRIKSFSLTRRILPSDLFAILASLKSKGFFYKKGLKEKEDENYNIKSKPRSGLISN